MDLDLTRVQPQMRLPSKQLVVTDPAFLIEQKHNEYMLIWNQPVTAAAWLLSATMLEPFTCTILRAGVGELAVAPVAPATLACGLDGPAGNHRGIAYRWGYGFLHLWNLTAPVQWVLSGATKVA